MSFSTNEVEKMQSIFQHLEPSTLKNLQHYSNFKDCRLYATYGVMNRQKQYVYVLQLFNKLSKPRMKILEKRKKEIPYPIHIIELEDNIICIGWKY